MNTEGWLSNYRAWLFTAIVSIAPQVLAVPIEGLCNGSADENIVDYAKNNDIDLIAMSRHGHSGLKRFFMGSLTDRVIRNGDTPVLVLPG